MRIITLGVVATALLGLVACSDSDEKGQEIKDTCASKCAITTDLPPSCKAQQAACDNACRALANKAEGEFYPGCGLCVASCRSGALHLRGFEEQQILDQIREAL